MASITRSGKYNYSRPVSKKRAEKGAERNEVHRELQHDLRTNGNAKRQAEIREAKAKQKRGEKLNAHEQGLVDGKRRTTSKTATDSAAQTALQQKLESSGAETKLASGSVDKQWSVFTGERTDGDVDGKFHNKVKGEALSVALNANGSVSADLKNATIIAKGGADVQANLVSGTIDGHLDSVVGTTTWSGTGTVGANASVSGQVVVDPRGGDIAAQVGGEAFAGARASAEVTHDIGPGTATLGAEAFAGVGVEFEANAGFQDGKLSASFDVGAALGIGASFEFGFELDMNEIASSIGSLFNH